MNLVKTHCAILCLPVVHTLRKMYCVLRDMYVVGILRYLQHLCTLEGAIKSFQNFIEQINFFLFGLTNFYISVPTNKQTRY